MFKNFKKMNHLKILALLLFVTVLGFTTSSAQKSINLRDKFNFSIQMEKSSFSEGEAIKIKIKLQNNGTDFIKAIYEREKGEYPVNNLKVKNRKQKCHFSESAKIPSKMAFF